MEWVGSELGVELWDWYSWTWGQGLEAGLDWTGLRWGSGCLNNWRVAWCGGLFSFVRIMIVLNTVAISADDIE
jgi:hypothetical protein